MNANRPVKVRWITGSRKLRVQYHLAFNRTVAWKLVRALRASGITRIAIQEVR